MNTKIIMLLTIGVLLSGCINQPLEVIDNVDKIEVIDNIDNTTENKIILNTELEKIITFLKEDKTNTHEYNDNSRNGIIYTCGHFARDLSINSTKYNMSIGSFTVTMNSFPMISGYNNHALNYFMINNTVYFIEPQTDEILTANDLYNRGFNYGKFYHNGIMVPTNFRGKTAATYNLSEHLN